LTSPIAPRPVIGENGRGISLREMT
jgi:hypothetical protein